MSVLELKNEILTDLATLNDERSLLQVRAFLAKLTQNPQQEDWWNLLSETDQHVLRRALEETDLSDQLGDPGTTFKNQGQWLA